MQLVHVDLISRSFGASLDHLATAEVVAGPGEHCALVVLYLVYRFAVFLLVLVGKLGRDHG